MKPIIINYNGDPNSPHKINHCTEPIYLVQPMKRIFNYPRTETEAYEIYRFISQCKKPITTISQIAWAFKAYPIYLELLNLVDACIGYTIKASVIQELKHNTIKGEVLEIV